MEQLERERKQFTHRVEVKTFECFPFLYAPDASYTKAEALTETGSESPDRDKEFENYIRTHTHKENDKIFIYSPSYCNIDAATRKTDVKYINK